MSELEDKLKALMGNPQLMQQIVGMAQAMGSQAQDSQPQEPTPTGIPPLDTAQLQAIMQAAKQTGVDRNQQELLHALSPYLSNGRISKLERAMRAAKLAGVASSFMNSGGLKLLSGR